MGMLEQLGVKLPLGVVGLYAEPVPKVFSGHRFRPKGAQLIFKKMGILLCSNNSAFP